MTSILSDRELNHLLKQKYALALLGRISVFYAPEIKYLITKGYNMDFSENRFDFLSDTDLHSIRSSKYASKIISRFLFSESDSDSESNG